MLVHNVQAAPSRIALRGSLMAFGFLAAAIACSTQAPPPPPNADVPVTVAVVRRGSAPRTITANGQLDPLETARVVAQVPGLVTEVTFHEGDWVRQGQVLFRIDPRPYADAVSQAQAAHARDTAIAANSVRSTQRLSALADDDFVTQSGVDSSRASAAANMATVALDRASIRAAQFNLANSVIRAPISGRTGSLLVRRGNYVQANPTLPLVAINQTDPISVRFNVPASAFAELQLAGRPKRLPVRVRPTELGAAPDSSAPAPAGGDSSTSVTVPVDTADLGVQGVLTFVDNAVDTTTGTVRLKAELPNPAGKWWPGQFAFISLELGVQKDVLLVPSQSVETGLQPAVYVVQSNGHAVRRPVKLGITVGRMVAVTSGLTEGERVITDGQSRLRPGARVRIVATDSTAPLAAVTP